MKRNSEKVLFTLIQTPCCHTLLCWVNPRMPNYCPECGKRIMLKKRGSHIIHQDDDARLRVKPYFDTELNAVVTANRAREEA